MCHWHATEDCLDMQHSQRVVQYLPTIRPMNLQLIATAKTRVRSSMVEDLASMANIAAPAPVPIPDK